MSLRIGFDMDGVLADFASAFHEVESRLFAEGPQVAAGQPEAGDDSPARGDEPAARAQPVDPHELRRRRRAIWGAIEATPDFWTTLKPTVDGAVTRIHELMLRNRWEVFFITQRPETQGDTVQRQTQRWLVEQGYDLPSVLVIPGSRGAAAAALRLDFHVDDSPQNCLDVMTDSGARTILLGANAEDPVVENARKVGIGVAADITACLAILEEAAVAQSNPGVLRRLAAMVGWTR